MGKQLQRKHSDVQFEDNHPGCMYGILHILDYHHWHNVKKVLPHKRHRGGRHARCNERPKRCLNDRDTGEAQKNMDSEADHSLVKQNTTKDSPANKRSGKARMKALISGEMYKEEDHKCRVSGFPARARLQRTDSIHHLELSDHCLGEVSTNWSLPIIPLHDNADAAATRLQDPSVLKVSEELVACNIKCDVCGNTNVVDCLGHNQPAQKCALFPEKCDKARGASLNQKLMDTKQLSNDVSGHQFKEYVDVLEIFKVNKELFLKILQNSDVGIANQVHGLHASNTKVRLTKSGSFPVAELSHNRNIRPSKLENKQNEIWSFPKRQKLLSGTQTPNLVVSKSSEDLYAKPLMADNSVRNMPKQETRFSSLGSHQGLHNRGRNQVVGNRLKDIQQGIKHAIKESKKESNLFHGVPYAWRFSTDGKEMAERWKESAMDLDGKYSPRSHETDGSVYDLEKCKLPHIRRTSSLNESLDRYAQLYKYSFNRETKRHLSKSLKLTNEDEFPSGEHAPKSFRRIFSLPDIESYCPHQNEVSCDALGSGMPIKTIANGSTNIESDNYDEAKPVGCPVIMEKCVPLDAVAETECQKNLVDGSHSSPSIEYPTGLTVGINDQGTAKMGRLSEDMDVLAMGDSSSHQEQEINFTMNASSELPQPSPDSVLENCSQDDVMNPGNFAIPEGSELISRCIHFDEPESSVNLHNCSSTDSLSGSCSTVNTGNVENANNSVDNYSLQIELNSEDDADFNYVRNVLELLGFTGNEYLGTWHPLDQPLNPSVFEEVEACLSRESECSTEEVCGSCDHQLLFDLVNEALLEIYERSVTYCPRALSFSCRIRPVPVGYHVLQEVWAVICRYLSLRPELDQSLDYVVARDLAKDDGWMNLQLETECVALELEDMIFDELLDEAICS